ncbi:hypothetical protein DPMN_084127 [Dreissena polymorpha]|uniref:Uncharacterized protein n=1 Tax=Dreissena polymorpha TaxID=45954 RepID=A0A9D4BBR7_DREPO|nr:hypothetical protein DPMN_084127 [Dreissena polymorpha]
MVILATAKRVIMKPSDAHLTSPKSQSPLKQEMIMKGNPKMTMTRSPPTQPIIKTLMCVRSLGVDLKGINTAEFKKSPYIISTTNTTPIAI